MTHGINKSGRRTKAVPESGVAPPRYRLPAATRLGPVRLQVADLSRAGEFYGQVLGLEWLGRHEGRASLGTPGNPEALIELVERPGARPATPHGRIGLYHFALVLPDRGALARFAVHVRGLGLRVGMADHLVSEALYLSDPDGLGIEVYADRPRSHWQWRGPQLVMTTEPLDLDDLISQAGADPFTAMPPNSQMGHVHLHVGDLDRAARFYHDALGFDKVVWDYPGALFLSAGGYHHHVGTNTWAANARPAGSDDARLLSWTLVLPGPTDLERTAANIEATGHRVTHEGGRVLAEDPWGTTVELVSAPVRPG